MNRKQAIDWCVNHVNKWPRTYKGMASHPDKWAWFNFGGEVMLINRWDKPIHQLHWIEALNKPHSDSESFFK